MEYQKIINLLDTTFNNAPKFISKKWIEVHGQSGNVENRYKPSKQIRFKKSTLQSDLYDYKDVYIVIKGTITVEGTNNRDRKNSSLVFKNSISFISCITKINNILIGNVEDLDIVMPMYNLIKYSKNFRKRTGSLCNYYRDEPNNPLPNLPVNNNLPTVNYNADPITTSASFKYKSSIIGKIPNSAI